jgi:hypothetical protein
MLRQMVDDLMHTHSNQGSDMWPAKREQKCIQGFGEKTWSKQATLKAWVGGQIGMHGVDWIYLALDRGQWRTLVNTAMNFQGSIKCVKFLD